MKTSSNRFVPCCCAFRQAGKIATILLATSWLALFIWELVSVRLGFVPDRQLFPSIIFPQGIALAVIFLGYALSWRKELLGAIVSLLGVVGFYGACWLSMTVVMMDAFVLFAVPGVLFLVSWVLQKYLPHDHEAEAKQGDQLAV